jgi:hypothetical protein
MTDGEKKPKTSPINGQPVPTNLSGRPKGVPNKATIEFKDALKNLLDYSAPKMVEWMEELDTPEKRFDVLNKFVEYVHPKLARTEIKNPEGETFKTTVDVTPEVLKHLTSEQLQIIIDANKNNA